MPTHLIFGYGYLGHRVAKRWHEARLCPYVVTRSEERARGVRQSGLHAIVADIMEPQSIRNLPPAKTVLYAVGYDRDGQHSRHDVAINGLMHVLKALPETVERFLYISSTGVYGQTNGEIVDENSPCQPQREGGRICLAAERQLGTHAMGQRSVILRMAGIYGPGRIPYLDLLRRGEPLAVAIEGHLNLIHVEDAVQAVLAAERQILTPAVVCVSDGVPVLRGRYYLEIARQLGISPPRFVPPTAGHPTGQRATSDKRVCNERLKSELEVSLLFPSFREGIADAIDEEGRVV